MKKTFVLLSICLLFGMKAHGQFSFGVAPGLSTNSSYFGYKAGKFVPYIGFQYANISFSTKETGEEFDYDLYEVVSYSDELNFDASLLVPNIGIKYFAVEQNNLKAFINLSIAKPFVRGKLDFNGEEADELSDALKDLNLMAGELGVGVEYFLDDNFSVGGEFGIRYIGGKYNTEYTDTFYNDDTSTYQETEIETTYKLSSNPTYSKISLNFYFGAKE